MVSERTMTGQAHEVAGSAAGGDVIAVAADPVAAPKAWAFAGAVLASLGRGQLRPPPRGGDPPAPERVSEWLCGCRALVAPELSEGVVPLAVVALRDGVPVLLPDSRQARVRFPMAACWVAGQEGEPAQPTDFAMVIRRLETDGEFRASTIRRGQAEARRPTHAVHLPASSHRRGKGVWPVRRVPPTASGPNRLSVIIACYGQRHLTARCVASLRADMPEAEIILVDNASPDDTRGWAREQGLSVLSFDENRGVAPAWNAGLKAATGDLLCVLNNDTVIHPGGMRRLAEAAWRTGISAYQGGLLGTDLRTLGLTPHGGEADYPDGCALLFRRDVWERVGSFDEGMQLAYCEDSDWGLRARAAGYGWELVPDALLHLGQQTTRAVPAASEHHRRNQQRLCSRWQGKGVGERIKVRRWGMLGDVLMVTPALAGLRREKPLARIHLQCGPELADLLHGLPGVDVVSSEELPNYTTTYDLDYATWDLEQSGRWRHPTYAFADALGVSFRAEAYTVSIAQDLEEWAAEILPGSGYVACGVRSEKRDKANWGEAAWLGLARTMPERSFVLFDREPEPSLEPRGEEYFGPRVYRESNVVDLTGKTPSLRHVFALLRRCQVAVCVDSGLFHLSAAAGLPVVGLMGGAPGWARQPLAGVQRIFQGQAPCYPCRDPWHCRRIDGGPHCLEWLRPELVAIAVRELLS